MHLSDYKLLVFDLDGTLVDTRLDLAAAVNKMRRHFSLQELPLDTIVSFVGDGATILAERALADSGICASQGLEVMLDFYRQNLCVHSRLYSDCRDFLLKAQSAGLKLAVLTNKPLEMTRELLRVLDIEHFFFPVLSPENAGCRKPQPDGLLRCIRENEVDPAQVLMIGDHHTDLKVAANSGCDAAFFSSGMGNRGEAGELFSFASYKELQGSLFS